MQVDVKHGVIWRTFKWKKNGRRVEANIYIDADKFNSVIKEGLDAIIKAKPDFPATTEWVEWSLYNDYIMIRVPETDRKSRVQVCFVDVADIDKICDLRHIRFFPDDLTPAQILELQKLIMTETWNNWKKTSW